MTPSKLFGSACLLISAIAYSYQLIRNAKERLAVLDGLCALILFIKNNIDSFMRPVGEIIASYSGYGESLSTFMEAARTKGLADAARSVRLPMPEGARQLLLEFSETIGSGYKEDALRLCTYCYNGMQEILKREQEETQKKLKLYRTLPVMSAMSVVLLLL